MLQSAAGFAARAESLFPALGGKGCDTVKTVIGDRVFKPMDGEIRPDPAYVNSMSNPKREPAANRQPVPERQDGDQPAGASAPKQKSGEIGGRKGPEPTRYGDWEVDGRCTDF